MGRRAGTPSTAASGAGTGSGSRRSGSRGTRGAARSAWPPWRTTVAAHALRGADAALNFPALAATRPAPASTSADGIRAAAAAAAASIRHDRAGGGIAPAAAGSALQQQLGGTGSSAADAASASVMAQQDRAGIGFNQYFLDEEALFETPQFLRNMAAGMMMSPPRLSPDSSDESPDPSEVGESLWSYRDP
uniref:AP2/ERF domain-containing protein n=1 Tax=Aegilops tauschii TaxID=37682 RepID=M8CFU9_AEGTA